MRRAIFSVGFALAVLLGVSVGVWAQGADPSWYGTWKVNLAKSKYDPPSGAPRSQTTKQEVFQKDGVRLTSDVVDAQGKATHAEYTYKFDGKDYVTTGTTTRSYTRIDSHGYQFTQKEDGKVTTSAKVVISADGKTRTITTTGKNAQGQTVNNVVVWDRQ